MVSSREDLKETASKSSRYASTSAGGAKEAASVNQVVPTVAKENLEPPRNPKREALSSSRHFWTTGYN